MIRAADAKYGRSNNGFSKLKLINRATGRLAPTGVFSPGKNRDRGFLVVYYNGQIGDGWRRVVQGMMGVARLCAEADARLTTAQKLELIEALPFGAATFSKLLRIGTDTRLHTPGIQRLLPAHYTITYAVTLLTDEELKLAIADKVIHLDMNRAELLSWRSSHREAGAGASASATESDSDAAVAGLPIARAKDAVESGALRYTVTDDSRGNQEQLAVAPGAAPAREAVSTAPVVAAPSTPPRGDDDIPPFLDRRQLSADDQRAFDLIMAALNDVSALVRERVRAALMRESTSAR
jgi:hypothetical protein